MSTVGHPALTLSPQQRLHRARKAHVAVKADYLRSEKERLMGAIEDEVRKHGAMKFIMLYLAPSDDVCAVLKCELAASGIYIGWNPNGHSLSIEWTDEPTV